MSIQTLRWMLYLLTGVVLLVFGLASLARTRRCNAHRCWPVPWGALSGWFLLSVALVQLTDAFRVYEDWRPRHELRISAVSLAFCAVMSCWLFWRWWRSPGQ